jgi:hypothetical protein
MKPIRHFTTRAAIYGLFLWPLVAGPSPCHANDSAFSGVSGTPKPLKGEHRSIAMQSEKVSIVASSSSYDTVVDFIFRNDGAATSVQMGFPESSYGDVAAVKNSTFLKFDTYVDGHKVVARRIVTSGSDGDAGVEAYWLKTVAFARHQTRRIRVAYRSPMGGNTDWGSHNALVYAFTGKNWKGLVDRSDLEVRVTKPGLWITNPRFDYKPLAMTLESTPKEAIFRKTWRNWQAQGEFLFGLSAAVPFWMMDESRVSPAMVNSVQTVRVGPVPTELPQNAELPDGFTRNGVHYIALSQLQSRLAYFADDLEKYRKTQVKTGLTWDGKTRQAQLVAGAKALPFSPNTPVEPGGTRPIFLKGLYGDSLYVPLDAVAKKLGIAYTIDSSKRLFKLSRGTWTGQ